ncbi:hypothetical protein SAMN04487910_1016 [Aquimarina amphilecti]|uniref:Collagen triple helix repeat-containing protein n=1 Tax=Aquimarina amphilecti TaxID=1038014 RepID=A0A1H7JLQ7_AQUAM|nr:hypothetical protein [Aquimarina amphilecti]SEK74870.1 hypothetical protein SAMN04487910_1016 [Aquimarina amphilecti]
MKTTMKFLTYVMMAFALVLTSCDGEDGANGLDGAIGPAGQDGNANVVSISVDAYTVAIGQNEILVPELTQDIYDNGLVFGYTTVNGNPFWETLPIVINENTLLDIDRIEVGKIILTSTFDQTLNFRFVIIEGTNISSFDFSNYEEVQNHYGLD